jgi:uncharacterized membrane protein
MSFADPLNQTVSSACHTRAVLEERDARGQLSTEDYRRRRADRR